MSIKAAIKRQIRGGRLFPLQMKVVGSWARGIFFTEGVRDLLHGPWTDVGNDFRANRLQSDLEAFVKGDPVEMCLVPFDAEHSLLGRLDPTARRLWDFRSRDPSPSLRVLGHFADPNIFIGLEWGPRFVDWNGRQALGGRHSPHWNIAMQHCDEQWARLFPQFEPIDGGEVHEFVTDKSFSNRTP